MFRWLRNPFRRAQAAPLADSKAASGSMIVNVSPGWGDPYNPRLSGNPTEQLRHFRDWSYAAIRPIAQRIAAQPIHVARVHGPGLRTFKYCGTCRTRPRRPCGPRRTREMAGFEPLDDHPLIDAIDNPNPFMLRWELMFVTVVILELCGRVYWYLDDSEDYLQIWPIPPNWMYPQAKNGNPYASWLMRPMDTGGELEIPGEMIAQFRYPDPWHPILGHTSPLQAQGRAVIADENLQRAQAKAFENGLFPGMGVRVGEQLAADGTKGIPELSAAQKAQIVNGIKRLVGGAAQAGEPIILDSVIQEIFPISNKPMEMNFLESGTQLKSRICESYGVNPIIMGEIEGANRASAAIADAHFCSFTVNPIIDLLSQALTAYVGPVFEDGLVCWIDECRPNDPEQTRSDVETLAKLGAITPNEARATLMGLPPIPGGDKPLVPINLMPSSTSDNA